MDSWLVFCRDIVILNQWTKRNDWSSWMVLQNVFRMESSHQTRDLDCFADRYCIPWNLPTNFHPDLIATIRHRCLPLLCALLSQQSHLFPICVESKYNDSRKIFTRLAKCQGIVSVTDFRIPIGLQALLQAPLCFLWSFCFARIRLDPLGGQVLQHDCISMIVSRFTTFTENFVICCNQVTKFSARSTAPPLRLLHGALVFLVLWQISRFRPFGEWVETLCLPKSALLAGVGSKDSSWEELACESLRSGTLSSTKFSLNSCSHSRMSEWHGSSCCRSWFSFLFGFGFWSVHVTSLLFQKCTGFFVLVYPHFHLTRLLDGDLIDQIPDLKESWMLR